jgi:cell division protein ZapA
MGQVSIKVRGRSYQVVCEDGQEDHLNKLGLMLDEEAIKLVKGTGPVSDSLLLVMVALLLGDKVDSLARELQTFKGDLESKQGHNQDHLLIDAIDGFTSRINSLADKIEIK